MAVATPKSTAKEPIAFDIILVCRKQPCSPTPERSSTDTNPKRQRDSNPTRQQGADGNPTRQRGAAHINPKCERADSDPITPCDPAAAAPATISDALASARSKIDRLLTSGFTLSRNDRKIILYGQLLTTLTTAHDAESFAAIVEAELSRAERSILHRRSRPQQQVLFEQT